MPMRVLKWRADLASRRAFWVITSWTNAVIGTSALRFRTSLANGRRCCQWISTRSAEATASANAGEDLNAAREAIPGVMPPVRASWNRAAHGCGGGPTGTMVTLTQGGRSLGAEAFSGVAGVTRCTRLQALSAESQAHEKRPPAWAMRRCGRCGERNTNSATMCPPTMEPEMRSWRRSIPSTGGLHWWHAHELRGTPVPNVGKVRDDFSQTLKSYGSKLIHWSRVIGPASRNANLRKRHYRSSISSPNVGKITQRRIGIDTLRTPTCIPGAIRVLTMGPGHQCRDKTPKGRLDGSCLSARADDICHSTSARSRTGNRR